MIVDQDKFPRTAQVQREGRNLNVSEELEAMTELACRLEMEVTAAAATIDDLSNELKIRNALSFE